MNKNTWMRKLVFPLGILCLVWIIYDILAIYSDLDAVIHLGLAGLWVGIGYLFILIFHLTVFFIYLYRLRHHNSSLIQIGLPIFIGISFVALMIEKVMFDEVGREYFIEFPMPGETHFIIFALLINAFFILYALYCLSQGLKVFKKNDGGVIL